MRVRTYCLPILLVPVILTISCCTFAFAVQCYEGWTNTAFQRYLRAAKGIAMYIPDLIDTRSFFFETILLCGECFSSLGAIGDLEWYVEV
ncbi:hypothetical protein ALC53_12599 [Atta colombica]|uniref:Uncharacterized protein n=1 Tax=Atta colombica TaxID=520822 RepID=A0A151HZ40_9HYME|nr:hypothetical protein ALC53_12599 [Atta colombica]